MSLFFTLNWFVIKMKNNELDSIAKMSDDATVCATVDTTWRQGNAVTTSSWGLFVRRSGVIKITKRIQETDTSAWRLRAIPCGKSGLLRWPRPPKRQSGPLVRTFSLVYARLLPPKVTGLKNAKSVINLGCLLNLKYLKIWIKIVGFRAVLFIP